VCSRLLCGVCVCVCVCLYVFVSVCIVWYSLEQFWCSECAPGGSVVCVCVLRLRPFKAGLGD